jgi:putative colanic acid biosynthesis acetyltransferase WcaF
MMVNIDTRIGPSFSLSNRFKRLFWNVVYVLVFKYSPKPFHGWRRFILKLFKAKVGKGVHVYGKVKIWAPWNLELADFCGIGDNTILYSQDKISIGKNTVISQGSHICTGTHNYESEGFELITKPITIGANVWIAAEVFVHPGVTIEDDCIIGARSVVIYDMPKGFICAGFPCKPIKQRIKKN